MIRILLVDDQNLVRQGIKSLLDQDPDLKVIGTVKDGRSAVKQIDVLRPDIVLLDIEMPGMDGITATKYISHLSPKTKVIILSSYEDKKYLTQAFMAGAKAYILKNSLMKDLKQAILAVNDGYSHIESRLLAKIFDPNNLKLRGSKSELETHKVNPRKIKTRRSFDNQTQKTATNLQPQAIIDNLPTANQSLRSQEEVAQASGSDTLDVEQSDDSGSKTPSTDPTIVNAEIVNSEIVNSEVNVSNLDLAEAVEQNDLAKSLELDHNNLSEDQEQNYSSVTTEFLPTVIVQRSSAKLASPSNRIWTQLSVLALRGKNYLRQISSKPQVVKYKTKITRFYQLKISQWQPIVRALKAKLSQYQSRLSPIIKRWYDKGWLANIGLVLLGMITVVIIHQMFS